MTINSQKIGLRREMRMSDFSPETIGDNRLVTAEDRKSFASPFDVSKSAVRRQQITPRYGEAVEPVAVNPESGERFSARQLVASPSSFASFKPVNRVQEKFAKIEEAEKEERHRSSKNGVSSRSMLSRIDTAFENLNLETPMSFQFGPDYVRALAPYQGGKPISEVAREFGLDERTIVKLASNENPLGISPSAKQAMQSAIADIGRYPDANGFELKAAVTAKYGVPSDWITLGNGSNDILELAARALVEPGQAIMYSQYSFVVYALAAQAIGARAIVVPAAGHGHDLAGMTTALTADTKVVFIANPNNPTGTFVPGKDIEAFLGKVPPDVVVVLDEAYTEYLPKEARYDSIGMVRRYPNLLVTRTLSKAYGLAGLRIGFGIAQPAITDLLNRIRQPFNVNSMAQAGATAALGDTDFLDRTAAMNTAGYRQLTEAFSEMGLEYIPSFGNFVMVRVGDDDEAGMRTNLALLKRGIIVRPVTNYGLPQWLRISIGLPEENTAFIEALKHVLP